MDILVLLHLYQTYLMTILALAEATNDTKYKFVAEQATFDRALQHCQTLGEKWDLPTDQDAADFIDFMSKQNIFSCWLGVRKVNLLGWRWVDGSSYNDKTPLRSGESNYDCAGLTIPTMSLAPLDCAEQGVGFACHFLNKSRCPEEVFSQNCLKVGHFTFLIGCNSENWYQAREVCQKYGGDLAVLKTEALRESIFNFITTHKLHSECDSVYVGLRKQEWQLTKSAVFGLNNSDELRRNIKVSHWNIGQPRQGPKCAFVELHERKTVWRTNKCDNQNKVICQNYGLSSYHTITTTSSESPKDIYWKSKTGGAHWFAISLALLLLILLTAILFTLVCFFRQIQKRRQEIANSQYQEAPMINCLGLPVKVKGIKLGKEHTVTVVLISSSLFKSSPILNGAKIIERDWPGNNEGKGCLDHGDEEAEMIIKVFKKVLKIKTLEKSFLRIVHIRVRKPGKEFPIVPLLTYIAHNSPRIDVVIMPNFSLSRALSTEGAQRAIALLKEIKEDTIVVCASIRHNDIPSREVIAVGVAKGQQTIGEVYGATDFVVDIGPEKVLAESFRTGPSMVAGFAAGLISLLKLHTIIVSKRTGACDSNAAKTTIQTADTVHIAETANANTLELHRSAQPAETAQEVNDVSRAINVTNYMKTTGGMRQFLLEMLQKKASANADNNPYWAFGKLEHSDLKLNHDLVIKQAYATERLTLQRLFDNDEIIRKGKVEMGKGDALAQIRQELFEKINVEPEEAASSGGSIHTTNEDNPSNTKLFSETVPNDSSTLRKDDYLIKIAIVGRGLGKEVSNRLSLSDIHQDDIFHGTEDQSGISVMRHVFSSGYGANTDHIQENQILTGKRPSDVVGLNFFPALDEGMNVEWDKFGKLLESLRREDYHVVHIYGTASPPLEGYQIGRNLKLLEQKSVVLTCAHNNTLPANFPSESAISVGSFCINATRASVFCPPPLLRRISTSASLHSTSSDSSESRKASLVDGVLGYLSSEKSFKKSILKKLTSPKDHSLPQSAEDESLTGDAERAHETPPTVYGGPLDFLAYGDNHYDCPTGSYYATAVVSLVILRAIILGVPDDKIKLIRRTDVMHSILRAISSHPNRHDESEGWGVIYPWHFLRDKDEFLKLIDECTDPSRRRYFWAGKNM